jgi:hypothetical protein
MFLLKSCSLRKGKVFCSGRNKRGEKKLIPLMKVMKIQGLLGELGLMDLNESRKMVTFTQVRIYSPVCRLFSATSRHYW